MYSKKVLEVFRNPKNMGIIKNPDGVGKIGNPVCGDLMWVYIKVANNKKGEEFLKDVKVKTFGCVAAIATSSVMTKLVIGKTLKFAKNLKKQAIAKHLGGLPPEKMHCSNLAADALQLAIKDYENKLR